jgi:hypothetical protein
VRLDPGDREARRVAGDGEVVDLQAAPHVDVEGLRGDGVGRRLAVRAVLAVDDEAVAARRGLVEDLEGRRPRRDELAAEPAENAAPCVHDEKSRLVTTSPPSWVATVSHRRVRDLVGPVAVGWPRAARVAGPRAGARRRGEAAPGGPVVTGVGVVGDHRWTTTSGLSV